MRYVEGLPDHEGSVCFPGYNRSGCRTPMQWDDALPNAGFSAAAPERLYLPQDPRRTRPTLAAQTADPDSPLNRIRRLIRLRRETPALRTAAATEVLTRGYPFSYLRGGSHLVVVNPGRSRVTARPQALLGRTVIPLEVSGVRVDDGEIDADGFGYGVFALE
jgi:glycosidase